MTDTGIIILAAGSSSRLGQPKQLLQWQRKTLIEHVVDEAVAASLQPIIVVTGSGAENVSAVLKQREVSIIRNEAWQQGMASGIVKGVVAALSQRSNLANIILAVCDQPFVSANLFQHLLQQQQQSGKNIVACQYADTLGTPVLFNATYFSALAELSGAEGARKLLQQYADDVATIPFPQGTIDIDTAEDYQNLITKNNGCKV